MTNEELVKKIKDGQNELMSDLWAQIEPFVNLQAYKFVTARNQKIAHVPALSVKIYFVPDILRLSQQ